MDGARTGIETRIPLLTPADTYRTMSAITCSSTRPPAAHQGGHVVRMSAGGRAWPVRRPCSCPVPVGAQAEQPATRGFCGRSSNQRGTVASPAWRVDSVPSCGGASRGRVRNGPPRRASPAARYSPDACFSYRSASYTALPSWPCTPRTRRERQSPRRFPRRSCACTRSTPCPGRGLAQVCTRTPHQLGSFNHACSNAHGVRRPSRYASLTLLRQGACVVWYH